MKVLVNAVSAHQGGIHTYTRNMLASFGDRGIDVTIAVPPELPPAGAEGAFVVRAGSYGPIRRLLWDQAIWRGIVRRHAPDVLFSSANFALLRSPVPQLLLMREGGLFNPYYLRHIMPRLSPQVRLLSRFRRRLMLQSIAAASVVMFPSETLRDWVLNFSPGLAGRSVVNYYGIDVDRFAPRPARPVTPGGPLKLLYVSVYYPHKDPNTLVRAVALLREGGIDATAHITMDRGEFTPWSCGPADYRGLKEHERLGHVRLGPVRHADLPATYAGNDIFAFPSVSETFGFPLVEAMATGLPVVAADTLTNREICGPSALYHPPGDASALASRVRQLHARPDLYQALRAEGIARANARFRWHAHLDRLVATLERLGGVAR